MAITTFKATVVSTDDPNKYISQSRDFTVVFKTNQMNNGYDEGITPNEGILCALGACEDIVAASFYKKEKFEYSSLYIPVSGDISDARPGFNQIGIDVHFRTPKDKSNITKFVKFMEKTCPVRDNLVNAVPIVTKGIQVTATK